MSDVVYNSKQTEALERLSDFIVSDDDEQRFFGLFGYAGTGKTLCTMEAVKRCNKSPAITAPTHKAVGVLSELSTKELRENFNVKYGTIHSLLALKGYRKGSTLEFRPSKKTPPVHEYDLLIVDEVSMLDDRMLGYINDAANYFDLRVIFMGDPLQLPPVSPSKKKKSDNLSLFDHDLARFDDISSAFSVPGVVLDEIMRYGGAIEQTVAGVRGPLSEGDFDGINLAKFSVKDETGEVEVGRAESAWFDRAVDLFEANVDAKILAHTNRRVDQLNANIRRRLLGDDIPDYIAGENFVAISTYTRNDHIVLHTEEQFELVEVYLSTYLNFDAWFMTVKRKDGTTTKIKVLHKDEERRFAAELKTVSRAAAMSGNWDTFWTYKEAFASIRLPYATTVYKSQGSTFENVFVDQREIVSITSKDAIKSLRARLMYVAYSRASKRLDIFY